MSSSRGGDRGKGIAQDQSTRSQRSRRPSRRDVLDEVSRREAERLQVSSYFILSIHNFINHNIDFCHFFCLCS